MPGRKYEAVTGYRYGFNGKENDKDITAGGQDYGLRIYDWRIGKFLSVDPLTKEYPWNSTYAFAENDVIRSIDLEGAEKWVTTYSYKVSDGKTVLTTTDDKHKCPPSGDRYMHIHPSGPPETDKQIAAHSAITYQRNAKPGNGSFAFFEFDPALGKSNYAKYTYTDANGQQQVQYFSQADMQYRFEEIETAKKELDKNYNIVASLANLVAAGWILKAELKVASGELKAATTTGNATIAGKSASSEVLGKNLELSGTIRPANSAAHHIVAGTDPRAAIARGILKREGIDINESLNGVFLPKNSKYANPPASTHSTLHTDKYYQEINRRLTGAKSGEVKQELNKIKDELLKGTFPK